MVLRLGELEVDDISVEYTDHPDGSFVRYGPARKISALTEINFSVRNGDVVALVGKNGSGKNRTGHNGKDTVIKVPVGTVILSENKKQIYKDFKKKEVYLILEGGSGGKGNYRFKSSTSPDRH